MYLSTLSINVALPRQAYLLGRSCKLQRLSLAMAMEDRLHQLLSSYALATIFVVLETMISCV